MYYRYMFDLSDWLQVDASTMLNISSIFFIRRMTSEEMDKICGKPIGKLPRRPFCSVALIEGNEVRTRTQFDTIAKGLVPFVELSKDRSVPVKNIVVIRARDGDGSVVTLRKQNGVLELESDLDPPQIEHACKRELERASGVRQFYDLRSFDPALLMR